MKEKIKKIFVCLFLLVLIFIFYLFFSTSIFWLIALIQIVFVVLFVSKWDKKWLLWMLGFSLFFVLLFKLLPSTGCGYSGKMMNSDCDCYGVKKSEIDKNLGSDISCIGKVTKCYVFKTEVPCK
jgi:energy-coupling factor transporter transmembrane protein EcfT